VDDLATPRRRLSGRTQRLVAIVAVAVLVAAGVLVQRSCGGQDHRFTTDAYRGLGAWVDVFDYVPAIGGDRPPVGPDDVDAMAALGVRTLYLQAAFDSPRLADGAVPADLLAPILRRAHGRGLRVVGWYAPRFLDPAADLRRLVAITRFSADDERFDGLAVDIEDRSLTDVAERNRRLVDLSRGLRAAIDPDAVIGAIVLSPVLLENVNPRFWPAFPWAELAPSYQVWLPMAYWTDRRRASGFREPRRYVETTVARTRELLVQPTAPMHPIGGIGDALTEGELDAFASTLPDVAAIGGSVYDYRTMPTGGWGVLRGRVPR
jgi:hypothetical protein